MKRVYSFGLFLVGDMLIKLSAKCLLAGYELSMKAVKVAGLEEEDAC